MLTLRSTPGNPVPPEGTLVAVRTADGRELRAAYWWPTGRVGAKGTVCLLQGRAEFIEKYYETIGDLRRRGFAVVASEMKLLADQAKAATGQVRGILSEIQRGINTSVMLTEEAVKRAAAGKSRSDTTQRTIEEITARVEESTQTFQQIVASTNQQQLGIEQVMGALQNIRQASQQTAAGTREVEAASANLTELAQALMTLAERYRH